MARFASPPVEYLQECSSTSLRYFEMSKLEHAANLRRELAVLLDEMMEETALALLARWMLERRSGRGGSASPSGEPRGRRLGAAGDVLADWLSSACEVESALPASTNRDGSVPAPNVGADPRSSGGSAEKSNSPLPAGECGSPSQTAQRPDRPAERKGGRTARLAPRRSPASSATNPSSSALRPAAPACRRP
jgi:hypothetical protein